MEKLIEKGNEEWKDIKGWEGLYQVSNLGRIKSLRDNSIRKLKYIQGYTNINLCRDKTQKWYRVHRLVAEAFIPNPEYKRTVNHKNGIRDDNRVENLERATYSEQERHARDVLGKTSTPPDQTKFTLTYNGITDSIRGWSKKLGIRYDNILWRLHKGRPIEKVLGDKSYRGKNYGNKLFNK